MSILLPNYGMCRFHPSKKISSSLLSFLGDHAMDDTNGCPIMLECWNLLVGVLGRKDPLSNKSIES